MVLRRTFKNYLIWGSLGALFMTASLLLGQFGPDLPASDFVQGMLLGMSLVFNITFLILWGKHRTA